MYWIPFVQALGIDPKRLIPISRGGAAVWYGTPEGIELYDIRTPKDVRIENMLQHARTGMLKQNKVTPFDKAVIEQSAKILGLKRYLVLHPAWMYQVLAPFWNGQKGLEWLWPHITQATVNNGQPARMMAPLRVSDLPEGVKLPPNFCAVRFYLRATFPHCDVTVQLARESIKRIAAQQPVVLLNPGVHADEHIDLDVKDIPNVVRLKDLCEIDPRQNLAIQAAVIARAAGFVGTYGGMAQLALRLNRPSISYFLNWHGTAVAHKHLSDAMSLQTGVSFLTVRMHDIPLLKTIVPDIAFQVAGSSQKAEQPSPEAAVNV
jgi:hypothetical protein